MGWTTICLQMMVRCLFVFFYCIIIIIIHLRVRVYVCARTRACVRACAHACVCVCGGDLDGGVESHSSGIECAGCIDGPNPCCLGWGQLINGTMVRFDTDASFDPQGKVATMVQRTSR